MEEIKVNKTDLLVAYSSANRQQKEILEKLYGKELFAVGWLEITSKEKEEFVGKRFFELCCACYGLTVKMDY